MRILAIIVGTLSSCGGESRSTADATENGPGPGRGSRVSQSQSHDFGEVYEGQIVEHRFGVVNPGSETLSVENLETSCGCALADVESEVIPPGESGEISFTVDTIELEGPFRGSVDVHFKDEVLPPLRYRFRMRVVRHIRAEPRHFKWGKLPKSAQHRATAVLRSNTPFRVTKVESGDDRLEVTVGEPDEQGNVALDLCFRPGGKASGYTDERAILLHTDHPAQPVIRIPWDAVVVGDTRYEPHDVIAFGSIDPKVEMVRSLFVRRDLERQPLVVERVEIEPGERPDDAAPDAISLGLVFGDAVERKTGREWEVTVRIKKGAPYVILLGHLAIYTNDPDEPVRRLQLWGTCLTRSEPP